MNYLAHAYLSFHQPGLVVGNMISDFVKGKRQYDYPPEIFQGIKLHRAIDEFTDAHTATRQAKEFFRPAYRLYAGAFVDVVFDHFVATDILLFNNPDALKTFSGETYQILQDYYEILPQRFQQMLPYMQQQNWLYNYRFPEGIEKSLGGVVRRSAYLTESAIAFRIFEENYNDLKDCYQLLFPELIEMTKAFIQSSPAI